MGDGHCIDSEGERYDVYSTYDDPDMTAKRCAQLCTQQPLCIGLSWNHYGPACFHWFPDGQAENLGAFYSGWRSRLHFTGDGRIQEAQDQGYYDDESGLNGWDCYRKGILINQFRKNSCQKKAKTNHGLNFSP